MTKNTLTDLNNHLFEQLERLNDEELNEEELKREITRSQAMTNVAQQIVETHRIVIDAQKVILEYSSTPQNMQPLIEMK